VHAARRRQIVRQAALNAQLDGARLRAVCEPADQHAEHVLGQGAVRLSLSVRAVARVMRVARTIADLEGAPAPAAKHLAEALHFRLAN
jgi:magnesium chelatase family protein